MTCLGKHSLEMCLRPEHLRLPRCLSVSIWVTLTPEVRPLCKMDRDWRDMATTKDATEPPASKRSWQWPLLMGLGQSLANILALDLGLQRCERSRSWFEATRCGTACSSEPGGNHAACFFPGLSSHFLNTAELGVAFSITSLLWASNPA